jgi:hypothetical protein
MYRKKNYTSKEEIFEEIASNKNKPATYTYDGIFIMSILLESTDIAIASKLLAARFKNETYFNTYRSSVNIDLRENSTNDISPRGIFQLNSSFVSIFDLLGMEENQIFSLVENANYAHLLMLAYCHFINKYEYENASRLFTKFNKRDIPITVVSNRTIDFIPYFLYSSEYSKLDQGTRSNILQYYMLSINKDFDIYNPSIREEDHLRIMKKFSKEIYKLDLSSEVTGLSKDLNYFDLVESDPIYKEDIFRVSSYESTRILEKMLKDDKERTIKLIFRFLNQEHYNGKSKNKFLGTYSRLSKLFQRNNMEIDVFQLNEKLRSYVVLAMLS